MATLPSIQASNTPTHDHASAISVVGGGLGAPDAGMPRVPLDARHTSSAQLGLMLKPAYSSNPTGQLTLGAPGLAYRTQVIPMHSTAKAAPIQ